MFFEIVTIIEVEEHIFECVEFVDQRAEGRAGVGGFAEGVDYGADEFECCEKVADGEAETYGHRVQ